MYIASVYSGDWVVVRECKMKRNGHGWIGAASAVIPATYRAAGAELEGKAFRFLPVLNGRMDIKWFLRVVILHKLMRSFIHNALKHLIIISLVCLPSLCHSSVSFSCFSIFILLQKKENNLLMKSLLSPRPLTPPKPSYICHV